MSPTSGLQSSVDSQVAHENRPQIPTPRAEGGPRLEVIVGTILRLGITNVARVLFYRVCKRAGIYRWRLPQQIAAPLTISSAPISSISAPFKSREIVSEAAELLNGQARFFSVHVYDPGNPPDWFLNPFQKERHPDSSLHWSEIRDFRGDVGDIKAVWEMSRFHWASIFARAFRISGETRYLSALRFWTDDWWQKNPPNTGPNWMCGQETSIRLINLLTAFRLVNPEEFETGLIPFVEAHCRRVQVTHGYAIAQENNHATSEAAGLFIGGLWLAAADTDIHTKHRGERWAAQGRALLERSVRHLVSSDGSFSQHSLTYHRILLDTLSLAEIWRRALGQAAFSNVFYERAAAATRWLESMIDFSTGDGPNLGSNDGAYPYRFDGSHYRDFRPTLQLASRLFLRAPALEPGPWDEGCAWLGVSTDQLAQTPPAQSSRVFPDGGYVLLQNSSGARALIRTAAKRFRPPHADALHLDLWWRGQNILRDGGTYSYAEGGPLAVELASIVGHNLPQFDDHDQMPRLSRFLFGDWVKVSGDSSITSAADSQSWTGGYVDRWGGHHRRSVTLHGKTLTVVDQVEGFKDKATFRWRLAPGDWRLRGTDCSSAIGRVSVESNVPVRRVALEEGWESRHYLEYSPLPVLAVEVGNSPATLTTTIELA